MRLTRHSEYSLRLLMYLGLHPDRLCSIAEIAADYGVSEGHLTKVAHALGRHGFIETHRGRRGGLRLARPARAISLADVIRHTEGGLRTPGCLTCPIVSACTLASVVDRAFAAFLQVFEQHTVADLLEAGDHLRTLLTPSARVADETA